MRRLVVVFRGPVVFIDDSFEAFKTTGCFKRLLIIFGRSRTMLTRLLFNMAFMSFPMPLLFKLRLNSNRFGIKLAVVLTGRLSDVVVFSFDNVD
jgi:hypothetical protein